MNRIINRYRRALSAAFNELRKNRNIIKGADLAALIKERHEDLDLSNVQIFNSLPAQVKTPEMIALQKRIKPRLINIMVGTPLNDEDFKVIGMVVQIGASIENNMQRLLRLFVEQGIVKPVTRANVEITRGKVIAGVDRLSIQDSEKTIIKNAIEAQHRFMGFGTCLHILLPNQTK